MILDFYKNNFKSIATLQIHIWTIKNNIFHKIL